MNDTLLHVASGLSAARRNRGGVRPAHAGWLHDLLAHHPWVAWPVIGLMIALLIVVLIGCMVFRLVGDVPWWVRLSLMGAGLVRWRKTRQRLAPRSVSDASERIDLSDLRKAR